MNYLLDMLVGREGLVAMVTTGGVGCAPSLSDPLPKHRKGHSLILSTNRVYIVSISRR